MKLVGLTGGIGCGKSTVSRILTASPHHGANSSGDEVVVIDADAVVHRLQRPGTSCVRAIQKAFPTAVSELGVLDREELGRVIFADHAARRRLGAIMNKRIMMAILVELVKVWWRTKRDQLVILDVPLLFETGMDKLVSASVVVSTTRELQVSRQVARNGISEELANQKIDAQMPMDTKERRADYVIQNKSSMEELEKAVNMCKVWAAGHVSPLRFPCMLVSVVGGAFLVVAGVVGAVVAVAVVYT